MYNYHNHWNWSTKSLSSPSYPGSISSFLCCVPVHIYLKTLTEDFLYFLSSISIVCLSYPVLSCVYTFCTLYLFSFHHGDHAHALLCLLLSSYSAAGSSSLRNFLTHKFLSEEFIKITYSPPSGRRNTLSLSYGLKVILDH